MNNKKQIVKKDIQLSCALIMMQGLLAGDLFSPGTSSRHRTYDVT
jgi:hypothetical protein